MTKECFFSLFILYQYFLRKGKPGTWPFFNCGAFEKIYFSGRQSPFFYHFYAIVLSQAWFIFISDGKTNPEKFIEIKEMNLK
jgi:hypothetical protein